MTDAFGERVFARWFAWHPVIVRDQHNRTVLVWLEDVWRRRNLKGKWEYSID